MRLNAPLRTPRPVTHEGAPAARISDSDALRRSVLACLLWEDNFYEDGVTIAERITQLAMVVAPTTVAELAIEARTQYNLRHVPLLLLSVLADTASGGSLLANTIPKVILRADELSEFLVVHAVRNGVSPNNMKRTVSAQMKRGLAAAFKNFDKYQLAKYDRAGAVRLRDVLFLVHAKPDNAEQEALWKQLVTGTLPAPDTWESAAAAGADKKENFTRLLKEGKLGYMALLRNLRSMLQAGVNQSLIEQAIFAGKGADRVLPFRYVAAARAVPQLEPAIDKALIARVNNGFRFSGTTIVLVDVSASMSSALSTRSDLNRMDAAATVASVLLGHRVRVFSFSNTLVEVPHRIGMAGVDAILGSQLHSGTRLGSAVEHINSIPHDRLVVLTDEQSSEPVPAPAAERAYMINVASHQNGVGYHGRWTHIDGFSERVLQFMSELEHEEA